MGGGVDPETHPDHGFSRSYASSSRGPGHRQRSSSHQENDKDGWQDLVAESTAFYYESVLEEMGPDQDDWMRLFMAPGMGHCGGGPGPNSFDTLAALDAWRAQGIAPDQLMGTNRQSGLTRPVCPYPQYVTYDGSGDLNDASNWACTTP